MTAHIVNLADMRPADPNVHAGNGAREALIEIGKACPFHVPHDIASDWADDLMLRLAGRGFVIVPVNSTHEA